MANPTSAIGASAAHWVGDVVIANTDVNAIYSNNIVYKPYEVLDVQCEPISKHSTTTSGYTWVYTVDYSGSLRNGGRAQLTEHQVCTFASGVLKAKISVSQWNSAPTT